MTYDFEERLVFSQGERGERDANILKQAITGCVDVIKTDVETDKQGIDYKVILNDGAEIGVDVKARARGVSKYWKNGKEDLLLEVWSVCPKENKAGVKGWTLSEKTNVGLILYTFDEADSENYYLLPYQLLRMAFMKNGKSWVRKYGLKKSHTKSWNTSWDTAFVYVPVNVVLDAIKAEMQGVMPKKKTANKTNLEGIDR